MTGEAGFDEEYADAGTATFERERDLSIENNVKDLIQKIDRALGRIDAGTFGLCERCGKPIEKARIKALPYANLCIKDAQAESRLR
jgi:RNA polymerase-binding protein DksA